MPERFPARPACPERDNAGPWVLWALGEDEAPAYAEHLETCQSCQAEVAALQGVADVLPMAAPQFAPPPELKSRIMATVRAEAQLLAAAGPEADRVPAAAPRSRIPAWIARLRPLPAAALASAVLALGIGIGVLASTSGPNTVTQPAFSPHGAQVALVVKGDHGALDLRGMPAPAKGRIYQVWLIKGKAAQPTHTLFTVPSDGRAHVKISDSLKGADQVLVTSEPAGGSKQPTTDPVIGAKLT